MSKKVADMTPEEIKKRDAYNKKHKQELRERPEEELAKQRVKNNANARKNYRKNMITRPEMYRMRHYRQRDPNYNLNNKWVRENIITKKCIYCGYDKDICCDRKDPLKGYTMDNCVPACRVCNVAKWDHIQYADFFSIGKVIKKLRKEGKIL